MISVNEKSRDIPTHILTDATQKQLKFNHNNTSTFIQHGNG